MGKEKCRKYFGERVQVENKVFYEIDVESFEGSSSSCETGNYLVCFLFIVEEFVGIPCNESVLMEYFIKHGVSESGVEELDYVLDGFGIQKDFKGIHDKRYNAVLQESSMAKLSIPIRYCPECHKLIRTKNVFCSCKRPFLKCCKSCGITEAFIKSIEYRGTQLTCNLTCNCIDATPNDTLLFHCASWEGLICMYHIAGFCDRMIATMPSTQLLLAEYCKNSKAISSLVDKNMVRLWRHINKENVATIMEEFLPTLSYSSDYIETMYQSDENGEELLFNVKSIII